MPKPSVALCKPKPTIRSDGQADLPRARCLADGESFSEVVHADADRDQERGLRSGGHPVEPATMRVLVDRGRPGTNKRSGAGVAARRFQPFGVVDERHQPKCEAGQAERCEPRELSPVALVERRSRSGRRLR